MSRPFVSVIIPVFENPVGLARCMQALSRQSYPRERFEVLVVDNGPTPTHASALSSLSNARLLHEPVPGSYAARNRALGQARGDVYAFTDSDCVPRADWIEKGVAALNASPQAGLVAGDVVVVHETSRPSAAARYDALTAFDQEGFVERFHFGVTANLFGPRSTFEKVGVFNQGLRSGGDVDMGQRVHAAGLAVLFAADAIVEHPARTRLAEVLHRTRRLHAGWIQWMPGAAGERRRIAWWMRRIASGLAPPLREARRLRGRSGRVPVAAILVAYLAKLVRLAEDLRLLVGGEAPR